MRYAEDYAENYLGMIFYFCLHKTGGEQQANELASDITYEVLRSLANGSTPQNFSAWVWRIAKNRYARWAEHKHRQIETRYAGELEELGAFLADDTNLEEALVLTEDIQLLRRELALIRSDYRRILVAHYLEDKSVSTIAKEQGLPIGTVKTRLQNSRKQLKEGIEMARTFGTLSYRPENITFSQNISKPGVNNAQAWTYLDRLLPRNILIAAYRNPMTAEELALELGISMPYLEEELAILENVALLARHGSRYEPTFFICSAEAQRKCAEYTRAVAPSLTKALEEYVDTRIALYTKNNIAWHKGWQSEDDMRWTLLMYTLDAAERQTEHEADPAPRPPYTQRSDGGEWDVVGREELNDPQPPFVGLDGSQTDVDFSMYQFHYQNIWEKKPQHLSSALIHTLDRLCRNQSKPEDADNLATLEAHGFVVHKNDAYVPAILVVNRKYGCVGSAGLPAHDAQTLDALFAKAADLVRSIHSFHHTQIMAEFPDRLRQNDRAVFDALQTGTVIHIRSYVLTQALADGWISYAADDPRKMLGVHLILD